MGAKRIEWIDVTKVIAMLLVIYGHCHYYSLMTDFGGINYDINRDDYSLAVRLFRLSSNFVYSFHMPLFVMLSGMCYTFTAKKALTWRSFVCDKFIRLIIPFFLVTFFLNIPLKGVSGYWNNSISILNDIILGQFFLLGNSHLWFVVSLFWIFICADCLIMWQTHSRKCNHYIVISILIILNVTSTILQYDYLGISNAMQYMIYFYLGYYMLPIIDRWGKMKLLNIVFFSVLLIVFYFARMRFSIIYESVPVVHVLNSLLYIVGAIGFSVICCLLCIKLCKKGFNGGFLHNNTYELYLYSDPINYLIIYFGWNYFGELLFTNNMVAILMVLFRFFGSLTFAYLVIIIVRFLRIKELRQFFAF